MAKKPASKQVTKQTTEDRQRAKRTVANGSFLTRQREALEHCLAILLDRRSPATKKFKAYEFLHDGAYDLCRCTKDGYGILHFHFDDYLDFEEFTPAWNAFIKATHAQG